jgi:hypothetical protein
LTPSKPESQAGHRQKLVRKVRAFVRLKSGRESQMIDDVQLKPAKAGAKKAGAHMTRQDRLAEELRANLKRRKDAARRPKERGSTSDGKDV